VPTRAEILGSTRRTSSVDLSVRHRGNGVATAISIVQDLSRWSPADECYAILLELMVGPAGGPGEESFDVTLCSAAWLGAQAARDGLVDARHHIVADRYDYRRIEEYFARRVSACDGETWQDVTTKVGRIGHWEFEDYRP
jgi:Immunity protein 8